MPSSSSITPKYCKRLMTRFERVKHTLVRKKFPILRQIINHLNTIPLFFRVIGVLLFVLWKFYIMYLLIRFLLLHDLSISSSARLDLLREGGASAGDVMNHTDGHLSSLLGNKIPVNGNERELVADDPRDIRSHIRAERNNPQEHPNVDEQSDTSPPLRVLHIVTALTDYNSGRRATVSGQDRLREIMIPVLVNSVETMISPPYHYQVDVYLILGWKLKPERRRLIEDALPEGVGLEIWDDATPLGYDKNEDTKISPVTRGLARQHRFVIRDKFDHYDFFSVFEDDMRITGGHISYFLEVTSELKKLYDEAPDHLPDEPQGDYNMYPNTPDPKSYRKELFHGPLSKVQLTRMMPGFLRVEVLLDSFAESSQKAPDPIPVDLEFQVVDNDGTISTEERHFDPIPCCHVTGTALPEHPTRDKIMLWEGGILGANVRKFPKSSASTKPGMLDWVLLQPGPMKPYFHHSKFVGGYWSGRDGIFGPSKYKPDGYDPKYFGQQGGWMATREQMSRIHHEECVHGFFPPFDAPAFKEDGLIYQSVEFWSGGIQLFSGRKAGCNMQRVVSLHPDYFSKHFLYHTANNKQKMLTDRVVKLDHFFGHVNSIAKAARKAMNAEKGKDN